MSHPLLARRPNYFYVPLGAAVLLTWSAIVFFFKSQDLSIPSPRPIRLQHDRTGHSVETLLKGSQQINTTAQYLLDYPLVPPYKNIFGELGERAKLLRSWVEQLEAEAGRLSTNDEEAWSTHNTTAHILEQLAISSFPYLNPPGAGLDHVSYPLQNLKDRLAGTHDPLDQTQNAGIVIPTGMGTLRFACHLIASVTSVHATKLPIQIVYAGEKDLPQKGRDLLQRCSHNTIIEFLDVLTVFDDSKLKLAEGGWAIKPFAALASRFDQVILLDADTVFIQDPIQLLNQHRFRETGALLFHDRLLWKGGFAERQDWWHEQIKHPSPETSKSKVWTERYSEEGDSGVVVVDKTRLDVLIGLLHVGWQNSYHVRDEWTYKITYGDKETWWIGFETTGSSYAFSRHYGGMVGWLGPEVEDPLDKAQTEPKKKRVCSFVIAHVDETDRLLWYNGGLLKNKLANKTEFEVPTHWMIDQDWQKGGKKDMSCMVGLRVNELTSHEKDVLGRCIDVAKQVDSSLGLLDLKT